MYTIATPDALAQAVHDLAFEDKSVDLSVIRSAVDLIEADRVRAVLRATADLEMATTTKGRRFVLAYWHQGKARTTRGVAYTDVQPKRTPENNESEAIKGFGVLVDDYDAPFYNRYNSVADFEQRLRENYKLQYVIRYID